MPELLVGDSPIEDDVGWGLKRLLCRDAREM
jgi:hypothetical protein